MFLYFVVGHLVRTSFGRLISQTQKVVLKGRYIGECTRLIFDLIEKMEKDDIPGLLVIQNFEKAFDTVEWSFLYKTLHFSGFGESFCSWIKAFYNDISSCIINNGHCPDYFKLDRGVCQYDLLSPYLFILVLELLAAALKNDKDITGVQIENSEFLLNQYADDSSLILDDNPQSLEKSLHVLSLV